jgi:integrase
MATQADLIRLSAYTGCRIEELCSLKTENLSDDRFELFDAQSEAGWRTIPIHNDLKQVIVRLIDTATGQYSISGLSFNKYSDRSNAIGKRFGKLKTRLWYGPDCVFHSLRKGFATQL